ncbi:MAG: transposase [Treponema sp.]|nr:transposase [Treponema sp.]
MEDILDVYTWEYDEKRVLVCMDEFPCQLIGETRKPIPGRPGSPECFDYEYVRNGTCSIFMFAAPLKKWRRAEVSERRTRTDWANQIKKLVDTDLHN